MKNAAAQSFPTARRPFLFVPLPRSSLPRDFAAHHGRIRMMVKWNKSLRK